MADIKILENDGRVQITAAASQTVLTYDFPIFNIEQLKAQKTVGTVTTDLVQGADYTNITGTGDENGGTITLTTPATAGHIYTIFRDTPVKREGDYQVSGSFPAETVNKDYDIIIMMIQELTRDLARSVKVSIDSTVVEIDDFLIEPTKFLRTNAAANGIELVDLATLSPPVVGLPLALSQGGTGATTASQARTNLGLGDYEYLQYRHLSSRTL